MRIAGTGAPIPIGAELPAPATGASSAGETAPAKSVFEAAFEHAVVDASERSRAADAQVQALAAGTSDDLHGTLISTKEAEISLRLVNSVRTKILDAFHELWRTNV